jgi:hypothetical protein
MNYTEEHKKRHQELHKCLDELVADFINFTGKSLSGATIMELMEWSYSQKIKPSENKPEVSNNGNSFSSQP